MKKLVSLLTAGTMLLSMATPAMAHFDAAKVADVPKVPSDAIQIDGQMDDAVWADAVKVEINQFNYGEQNDTCGYAYMLWGDGTMYVYYDITDKTVTPPAEDKQLTEPWYTDSVEMFLDFGNEHAAPVNQFRIDVDGWLSYGIENGENLVGSDAVQYFRDYKIVTDSEGYNIEIAYNLDKWGIKEGDAIGLQFQINDMSAEIENDFTSVWNMAQSLGAGSWDADLYDYIVLGGALEIPEEPGVEVPGEVESVNSGICGENLTWTLDENGCLTISGTGEMYDYDDADWDMFINRDPAPWYGKNISKVVIQDGVTNIGEYAFACLSISNVTIPGSVKVIERGAFENIYNGLTHVVIPEGVEELQYGVFTNTQLEYLSIPSTVKTLDAIPINSSVLHTVEISKDNPYFVSENLMVFNKDKTELIFCIPAQTGTVIVPDTVTKIASEAFDCCQATAIQLPDTLTELGPGAIRRAWYIKSLTIPEGITELNNEIWACNDMETLVLPSTLESIDTRSISNNEMLKSIVFKGNAPAEQEVYGSVETLTRNHADLTLYYYEGAEGFTTPTWTYYGNEFNTVMLSKDGHNDFHTTEVRNAVAATDTTDGYTGDTWCIDCNAKLADGIVIPAGSGMCGDSLFWTVADGVLTIFGTGEMYDYCSPWDEDTTAASPWYDLAIESVVINEGVVNIGRYAFRDSSLSNGVRLPSTLKTIEEGAFYESGLTSLTTVSGLESIEAYAFNNGALKEIFLSDTVKKLTSDSFAQWTQTVTVDPNNPYFNVIDNVLYNEAVTELIFCGRGVQNLVIPDSVTTIKTGAVGTSDLLSIDFGTGVTTIENDNLNRMWSMKSLVLPEGITSLGSSSLQANLNMESLVIPSTITSIDSWTVKSMQNLTSLYFAGNAPVLNEWYNSYSAMLLDCPNVTVFYNEGAKGFTTPTWTTSQGITVNTVEIPAGKEFQPIVHVPAVAATYEKEGIVEHWYCAVRDKYYADAACTLELDTITIPVLTPDTPSVKPTDSNRGNVTKVDSSKLSVDGRMDEAVWADALMIPIDLHHAGEATGTRGNAHLLWSDGKLYVYYDIKDKEIVPPSDDMQTSQPWNTDSVEMFLDFGGNHADLVKQFRIDVAGWLSYYTEGGETSIYGPDANQYFGDYAVVMDKDGYNIEAAIDLEQWGVGANDKIGLQLQINDMTSANEYGTTAVYVINSAKGAGSWDSYLYDYVVLSDSEVPVIGERGYYSAPVGTPVVDGVKDRVWANTAWTLIDLPYGSETPKSVCSARAKVMHDDELLYFLVDITDATTAKGNGDAFEIYLDEDACRDVAYCDVTTHLQFHLDGQVSSGAYSAGSTNMVKKYVVCETEYGYVLEIAIEPLNGIPTDAIGMEFMYNDADENATFLDALRWNADTFHGDTAPWQAPECFGTLVCEQGAAPDFDENWYRDVIYAAPELDGVINDSEWNSNTAIIINENNAMAWSGDTISDVVMYHAWDENGLYLAGKLTDEDVCLAPSFEEVYNLDAMQIALDPGGLIGQAELGGAMFFSIGPVEDGTLGAVYHPYGGAGEAFDYSGAYTVTDSGWQFEMMIPWSSIEILEADGFAWTHGNGEFLNALFCVLDRDENGEHLYQTTKRGDVTFMPSDYPYELKLRSGAPTTGIDLDTIPYVDANDIVVDCERDAAYDNAASVPVEIPCQDWNSGAYAVVDMLTNDGLLYLYFDVNDPEVVIPSEDVQANEPWVTDSIEFLFQTRNGIYDDIHQFRVDVTGYLSYYRNSDGDEQAYGFDATSYFDTVAVAEKDGGYIVELCIDTKKYGVSANDIIAVQMQLNDVSSNGWSCYHYRGAAHAFDTEYYDEVLIGVGEDYVSTREEDTPVVSPDDIAFENLSFSEFAHYEQGTLEAIQMRAFAVDPNGKYYYGGLLTNGIPTVYQFDAVSGDPVCSYQFDPNEDEGAFIKAIAADDRGYVYMGVANSANDGAVYFAICSEDGLSEITWVKLDIEGKVGVNGAYVRQFGDKYYLYFVTNYDTDRLYCYDVTDVNNPELNTEFGTDGIGYIDLNTAFDVNIVDINNIVVDEEGYIYMCANTGAGSKGDTVLKISTDGVVDQAAIPECFGIALLDRGYVAVCTYEGADSKVYILNQQALSTVKMVGYDDANYFSQLGMIGNRIYVANERTDSVLISSEINFSAPDEPIVKPAESNRGVVEKVLASDITIDGIIDEHVWSSALHIPIDVQIFGDDTGTRGDAYLLWADNKWYLSVDVTDADVVAPTEEAQNNYPWVSDSVEIFFDFGNQHEELVKQYRLDCSGWPSFYVEGGEMNAYGEAAKPYFGDYKVVMTDDGYNIEMCMDMTEYHLESGYEVGIQLQINDMTSANPDDLSAIYVMDSAMGADSWAVHAYDYVVLGELTEEDLPVVKVQDVSVAAGNTVSVDIVVEDMPKAISMIVYDFAFDTSALELVSAEWNVGNASMKEWSPDEMIGSIAWNENTDINGSVMTLVFRASEDIEGAFPISCKVAVNRSLGDANDMPITIRMESGMITVLSSQRGDVNGDGYVNSKDAYHLLRHTLLPNRFPINQSGDMNGDGYVNSKDAYHLLRHTLLPNRFPLQ